MSAEPPGPSRHVRMALAPVPASVGQARRFVTEAIRTACAASRLPVDGEALDTARLLVSELVTNAVIHARTEIGLGVTMTGGLLEVQVGDGSTRLPSQRVHTATATTGRGTELVKALASSSGTRLIAGGKVTWFALPVGLGFGADPRGAVPEVPAAVRAAPSATAHDRRPATSVRVTLAALPTALFAAFVQQAETLLREYLLAAFGEVEDPSRGRTDSPTSGSGVDRAAAAGVASGALAVFSDVAAAQLSALPALLQRADVTIMLPATAALDFPVLRSVLEEAVAMADAGQLLAPASQPEIVALRNWCCDQVSRQANGLPAQPWQPLAFGAAPNRPPVVWASDAVTAAPHAVIAADEANRIVAISPAVTALLGWSPEQLVGQRIVTLIPPDMREAHIAGFTHYLATGQARILNQAIPVRALHSDGHEVAIVLFLRRDPLPGGGAIFLAELSLDEDHLS